MTAAHRPEVVVFDVVGTLADLDPVRRRLSAVGQPESLLDGWFVHLLRDAMALTLAGGYEPFSVVAASSLRSHTRGAMTGTDVDHVIAGFGELIPHRDTIAALDAAAEGGVRVFTLSNGSTKSTTAFLDRAGLSDRVEQVLSIDEVRAWKPARAPYELAGARAGVSADRMALVAVHSWDIQGARSAGLSTGWCRREEIVPTPAYAAADVAEDTLDGVVRSLCALPDR